MKKALSHHDIGSFAKRRIPFRTPVLRKSLIDSKITKPLKTRVFAHKYIFLSCTGTLVKLTMNIYSSSILFLYIYAIIRIGCFRSAHRHTPVAIARQAQPFHIHYFNIKPPLF